MTFTDTTKNQYISLLRKYGFNCFPLPGEQKRADYRYKGCGTPLNQEIKDNENFGYIPVAGKGNAIIDIDSKERYRKFAENMINDGYMVIETGQGWHIPMIGLTGNISKTELFDYNFQDKKIVEIQGPDHYCVGPSCKILHEKLGKPIVYQNKGTAKIWDAKGKDFHEIIDILCKNLDVTARKKSSRSSYKYLRERFQKGEVPTEGTSNDYFFQAAIQCNTDGLSHEDAITKIRTVYDKWIDSKSYSGRPWSNVEAKIKEVYENDIKLTEGRPKGSTKGIDRTKIAMEMCENRKLYSDVETHEIFENCDGFLEKINDSLIREMLSKYPEMEQADYRSILFKLEGLAEPIPPTNKNLIVFKNGVYDRSAKTTIETDDIADMGFKDYNYLYPTKDNKPTEFLRVVFDNIPEYEHPRIKAGLRSVLVSNLDPKITVIHGEPGTGKTARLLILVKLLKQYGLAVELDQILSDKFIRAKIKGLRLLVLQDLPQEWKDFTQIKAMTGEQVKTERGFMQDSTMFENKLKIFASTNYLAKIPEKEKNAMYTRRLSLIHVIKKEAYDEDPNLIDNIVSNEGEKIISWILNIPDEECQYEDGKTVRAEWEKIASPELEYIENNFEIAESEQDTSIMSVIKNFKDKTGGNISIEHMKKALESQGFIVKWNIIKNLKLKPQPEQNGSVI